MAPPSESDTPEPEALHRRRDEAATGRLEAPTDAVGLDALRLDLATRAAGLGLFEWHPLDGRVLWLNERLYEIFGRSRDDGVVGSTEFLATVLHPDDRATVRAALRRIARHGGRLEQRMRVRRGDGSWRTIDLRAQAVHDAAGRFTLLVGVVADVTDTVRAQVRLQESEARFRLLFDALPVGVVIGRRDGSFYLFNDAAAHSLGYSREEFSRLRTEDVAVSHSADDLRRLRDQCFEEGRQVSFQVRHRARDGSLHDTLAIAHRIDLDGEPLVFRIWVDITERERAVRELAHHREQLALALVAGRMGMWEWRVAQPHPWWSPDLLALLEPKPDDAAARTTAPRGLLDRVIPEDRAWLEASWSHALHAGEVLETEFRLRRADGALRWFGVMGRCERDAHGRVERMLGVAFDVTERKLAEQRLHESDRMKDEFLAMLAHELRNPLAPIRNATTLLARHRSGPVGDTALQMLDRQVAHLSRLVDDLLEATRLTHGRIELKPQAVTLARLVDTAVETMLPPMTERGQRLDVQLPDASLVMHVDPMRIAQVLTNLLHNASKFSADGQVVTLAARQLPGEVELEVIDRGRGIEAATLPRLFVLFEQADQSIDRALGGLGIGLALAKRLVELHGGTIAAFSEGPGRGARFTVRLPLGTA